MLSGISYFLPFHTFILSTFHLFTLHFTPRFPFEEGDEGEVENYINPTKQHIRQ